MTVRPAAPTAFVIMCSACVQFRNSEDILHNVRVIETSTCEPVFNVASTMHASILVTASPYPASTDEDAASA